MPTNDNNTKRTERDIELFNNIAPGYIKKDLFLPSRRARQLRLSQTLSAVELKQSNIDILEVGCGAGFSAQYLTGHYRSFTGIDYSEELIALANKTHQLNHTKFISTDLFNFSEDTKFDVVILIGVLHHMPDIEKALEKCFNLLKPNGFIVANEPQPSNVLIHVLRKIRAKIDSSYSDEQDELDQERLRSLFKKAGLINVNGKPQGLLSTPFAEVIIKPALITNPLSYIFCKIDKFLEQSFFKVLFPFTWNIIVFGQKAEHDT